MNENAKNLLKQADEMAASARLLLELSLGLRRKALDAVQPGESVVVVFAASSTTNDRFTRQDDGSWRGTDGNEVDPVWIKQYWDSGFLGLKP